MLASLAAFACLSVGLARAHQAAWVNGMYCKNGASNVDNENTELVVTPLYQLSQAEWWFHNNTACLAYPPTDGEILEIPAGSSFIVEIATNRAYTTLSYGGEYMSDWPDGSTYPDDYVSTSQIASLVQPCVIGCSNNHPVINVILESMAAGTAFAISYTSDINEVTPENLVVFSVTPNTPWKRVTTYEVPAAMPPCPDGGCICGWGWISNGCGQANMYHQAFKCNVTGATGTVAVGTPQPPVWCEEDQSQCVQGPKQMLYWNQLEGNNIEVSGYDLSGEAKSPGYNTKCGFSSGEHLPSYCTDYP
ncbi:hypothetical protein FISHEDRAFT_46370 [Fistulina hepatica ATCC 64428]|uniref:Uncharacterized protein n=1 Tax=Fistulina hepatica ATCC 64428 TaxID=1128425 RepID=A0A0D7A7F0_9AGAR|nr:hypothetical protein FISHEDRAFT_46370 [Fistulina hepatica ATCC 64428]